MIISIIIGVFIVAGIYGIAEGIEQGKRDDEGN